MAEFADLLGRARDGDDTARDELLQRYLPELDRYVRAKSGPALRRSESLSDLVQTVCREVLAHFGSAGHATEDAFRGWLFTVAWRKLAGRADYFAAERRDPSRAVPLDEADVGAADATPSHHAVMREEMERVERAFGDLPDDYRDVILQVCLLGRSHREVAEDLGRSEEATRQLLSRARARLALRLEG